MSSNAPIVRRATSDFTRWPGLLRLAIDVVGAPIVALINQQAIYAGDSWACGHGARWSLHVAPALCLIAAVAIAIDSFVIWRAIGGGLDDEHADARAAEQANKTARTRFLALIGIVVGAFSAVVIGTQWFAIFMFDACMRA